VSEEPHTAKATPASGLSPDTYNILRIGAWALVIFGGVLLVVGLVGYLRKADEAG
jgi:hypothetical protein